MAHIYGTRGADQLVGFNGPHWEYFNGQLRYYSDGSDTIVGYGGNDELLGLGGDDLISGGGGNDFIAGYSGDDNLQGSTGNDSIIGGSGYDTISGGSGQDILDGGGGGGTYPGEYDQLFGGTNEDIFVLRDNNTVFIGDFELGVDKLGLDGFSFNTLTFANVTGLGVNLYEQGNWIATIAGVTAESIQSLDNFIVGRSNFISDPESASRIFSL